MESCGQSKDGQENKAKGIQVLVHTTKQVTGNAHDPKLLAAIGRVLPWRFVFSFFVFLGLGLVRVSFTCRIQRDFQYCYCNRGNVETNRTSRQTISCHQSYFFTEIESKTSTSVVLFVVVVVVNRPW